MKMKRIFLLVAFLGISGCASTVVAPSEATQAPTNRLLKYQSASDKDGRLTVVRDAGMVGSACYATLYINGNRAAQLDTKEKATFYLPAGEWVIGTNLEGQGLCGASNDRQERFITLKQGENKTVRIFTDGNGNMDVKPTTLN
ncbi:hypothetical protein [Pseudescherichia sp.]|jgi:hypothetical protein|uniref:hypothetical protein n=1 Tax=Pseudescherichia sp. TaxID=2055881 RepID=UPI0028982FCE|nr:hypothetical protein [Pseudescherichia sp.]